MLVRLSTLFWLTFFSPRPHGVVQAASAANDNGSQNDESDHAPSETDFVIIGGGTAGCVIATRLCQHFSNATIVVLEQGAARSPAEELRVAAMAYEPELVMNPETNDHDNSHDDPTTTRVQRHLTEINRNLYDPVALRFGRRETGGLTELRYGLGGASLAAAHWQVPADLAEGNIMADNFDDFDSWGIEGWNATTAKAAMTKAAQVLQPQPPPPALQQTPADDFLAAYQAAGFEILENDPNIDNHDNGERKTAYTNILTANAKGQRQSAWSRYLKPAVEHECAHNVKILQGAYVQRLVLEKRTATTGNNQNDKVAAAQQDGTNHPASSIVTTTAVEYKLQGDDTVRRISAKKDYILTAGPIGSPRLLQVSGIGDTQVLERAGVLSSSSSTASTQPEPNTTPTIHVNLPVGLEVQVRPTAATLAAYHGVPLFPEANRSHVFTQAHEQQFRNGQGGPLGVAASSVAGKYKDWAFHTATSYHVPMTMSESTSSNNNNIPSPLNIMSAACFVNAKSKGNLTITGTAPTAPLTIHTNLYHDPADFSQMLACVNDLNQMFRHFAKRYNVSLVHHPADNNANHAIRAYYMSPYYLSSHTQASWDVIGGNRVGAVTDGPTFHVRGVTNVRVGDASILPAFPVGSGTLSSVYAVAEFLAERLIAEYSDDDDDDDKKNEPTMAPNEEDTTSGARRCATMMIWCGVLVGAAALVSFVVE